MHLSLSLLRWLGKTDPFRLRRRVYGFTSTLYGGEEENLDALVLVSSLGYFFFSSHVRRSSSSQASLPGSDHFRVRPLGRSRWNYNVDSYYLLGAPRLEFSHRACTVARFAVKRFGSFKSSMRRNAGFEHQSLSDHDFPAIIDKV